MNIREMEIEKYIDILSSDAPAPGGGSAGALCGAQGIALALMVANLTLGREKYQSCFDICNSAVRDGTVLQNEFLAAVDKDTEAFNVVSAAYKMPRQTDEQKRQRSEKIAQATIIATQAPLNVMRLAFKALQITETLVGNSNTNLVSDLGAAAVNLLACVKSEWLNVLINLGNIKDAALCEQLKSESVGLYTKSEALAGKIFSDVESALTE